MDQSLFLAIADTNAEALQGGSTNGTGFSFMKTITVSPTSFMSYTTLMTSKFSFTKMIDISFTPNKGCGTAPA